MSAAARPLDGQVAVVTGAASGIGLAIADRLRQDGASVVIADVNADQAQQSAIAIGAVSAVADVTDSASVNQLAHVVMEQFGRVDIVVNNAGTHIQKLLVDLEDSEWDHVQTVNARGCFLVCRAFGRPMMERGSGRIVNIVTRLGGNPFSSAYIASKSAVWGLTQCLALELAPHNVTVNAVAPGHVGKGTGMEKWFRSKAELLGLSWEQFEEQVVGTIPLGRWCRPEDVAAVVGFLASEDASFITGELINVTGGWTSYSVTPERSRRQ